ncbi:MAG: sensor domain-containing protein [Thermoanaerobaculia bacterium]
MTTDPKDPLTLAADGLRLFLGAPFRLRTYTNLLYLMLAFPLGLAYFIFLIVGLTTGFGLTIVWIGLPLLALTFAGSWAFAAFERQAAILLLGADVPPMLPPPSPAARTAWQRAGDFFSNPVTWKGMGFLLLKFPLGIVSFVAVVALLPLSGALLLAPLLWQMGVLNVADIDGVVFQVDSIGGAWVCAILGLAMLFLSLNLLNALAWVWRGTATVLLGSDRFQAPAPPAEIPEAMAMA